jgi:hypothetical protein
MRFVVVTSLMTVSLIVLVSAISIVVLSWVYTGSREARKFPEPKIEIKWGEGS